MPSLSPDAPTDTQRKALEAFVAQNPDLARLESLLARFNVFEAIGAVRHELRHSDFLAYLLDPSRNHGLGTIFLKELLQTILLTTEVESEVSLFDLDFWNMSQAVVQREWHHIDILVTDEANRFAVIIENKIDSGERPNQLKTYHRVVSNQHPGYTILALFLTPEGHAPSYDAYHDVDYLLLCQVIEKIVADRRSTLGAEVVMALEHYTQMLRRHIVSESEVAELCSRIYQKHRQALDLIFEHRPDLQSEISQFVQSLVQKHTDLVLYNNKKSQTRFGLKEWNNSLHLGAKNNHISTLLYFQFDHLANKPLYLKMEIGAGDQAQREKLLEMAKTGRFDGLKDKLSTHYSRTFTRHFLTADDNEKTLEEIEELISEKWTAFLRDDLPKMAQAIREEQWLWTTP